MKLVSQVYLARSIEPQIVLDTRSQQRLARFQTREEQRWSGYRTKILALSVIDASLNFYEICAFAEVYTAVTQAEILTICSNEYLSNTFRPNDRLRLIRFPLMLI